MKISYNWLNIIQNYLLPPTCILCANPGMNNLDLCDLCYKQLPLNTHCCIQCANLLDANIPIPLRCNRCIGANPAFDKVYAPFIHQGAIRQLIADLKFSAHYKNARLLGLLLAEHIQYTAQRPDVIIPMPLHQSRYYQRGFNQSLEIANTLAKAINLPLNINSCIRHRNTPHQAQLPARERRQNMKGAFSIIKPITAQHVAIVDDVMTTGSSVHELAIVLKKSGVRRIDVWVCARA